jgi:hypothetical protein
MEARHFDQLAIAAAAGRSRRTVLRLLGVGAALGMVPFGSEDAAARDDPRCRGKATRSNGRCNAFSCEPGCICTRTATGQRACLDNFAAPDSCPTQDECDSNADCPRGYACAEVGGCCPEHPRRNYCLERCRA